MHYFLSFVVVATATASNPGDIVPSSKLSEYRTPQQNHDGLPLLSARSKFDHALERRSLGASNRMASLGTFLAARRSHLLDASRMPNSAAKNRKSATMLMLQTRGRPNKLTTNATKKINRRKSLMNSLKRRTKFVHKFVHRNRAIIARLITGGLGLLYGGAFPFTVLFFQSFGNTGLPVMRKAWQRAKIAYAQAHKESQPLRRELLDLVNKLAKLRREGASDNEQQEVIQRMREVREMLEELPSTENMPPLLVALKEPTVVRDLIIGLWSGVVVSLSTACHSAARTIGIGISLGDFVSKAGAVVLSKSELLLRKAMSSLPGEVVMLTYLGPSVVGSATIDLLGRWVGFWLARRLQNIAVVFSASLLFARTFLQGIVPFVKVGDEVNTTTTASIIKAKRCQEIVVWMLALGAVQNQRARKFRLPLALKISFLPLLGVEALLHRLADRLNSEEGLPFMNLHPPPGTPPS